MLKTIDTALAGAIDVIADDVQATVKSVRENGFRRTLGDAVEDAAGLVKTGASSVFSGVLGGKKGPEKISNHAGVSSSYADLCAGPGTKSMGGGTAFPYAPPPAGGKSSFKPAMPKFSAAGFAPSTGIQRAAPGPPPAPGGAQANVLPVPRAAGGPGTAQPRSYAGVPLPSGAPAPAPESSTPSDAAGTKDPPLPVEVLAARFETIRKSDAANLRCFDCDAANAEWASVSFGIFLCIECGGHHRQMGTHISRIRSCKMDSWTERQLQIFSHSGNRHLGEFFATNSVGNSTRFERYKTSAAEWYREAWIKNRMFGRPVPPPPHGIVAGPCVDGKAAPSGPVAGPKAAAPPVDLLDFGTEKPAAPAPATVQADLLGFDEAPATTKPVVPVMEVDLLGVAAAATNATARPTSNGDLLNFGAGAAAAATSATARPTSNGDLLNFGAGAAAPAGESLLFDFAAAPQPAQPLASSLASLDFASLPVQPAVPAPSAQAPRTGAAQPSQPQWGAQAATAPQPAQSVQPPAPMRADASAAALSHTMAGGAKLVDTQKDEKPIDPFAIALEKWGM